MYFVATKFVEACYITKVLTYIIKPYYNIYKYLLKYKSY